VTTAAGPHPNDAAIPPPEPKAPPDEPRVIVRRRSPGWPAPRKPDLPRTDEAQD